MVNGGCGLQDFVYQVGNPSVSSVKTNGLYYEPGEKSYMRETIAYQVLGYVITHTMTES